MDEAVFTTAMQSLADFEQAFGFLQTLPKQDSNAHKMGNKSVGYVDACVDAAITFPNHIPASINTTELLKDKKLFDQISFAITKTAAIMGMLENAKAALAQDLMQPCDRVYSILKLAAKNDPSLKSIVEKMGKRYERKNRPKMEG